MTTRAMTVLLAVTMLIAVAGCVPQGGGPGRYVPVVRESGTVMSFDTQTGTMRVAAVVR